MNKYLLVGFCIFSIIGIVVLSKFDFQKLKYLSKDQETVSTTNIQEVKKSGENNVPLLQGKDIVNNFFNLIKEGKASDAVMMMSKNIINDDSVKQVYIQQFEAMKQLKIISIEESSKSDWKENWQQYMVTFDVWMDPSSENAPIPYFGYENSTNTRFINLVKENNVWKIEGIATGP
jgi:hypothetical protein